MEDHKLNQFEPVRTEDSEDDGGKKKEKIPFGVKVCLGVFIVLFLFFLVGFSIAMAQRNPVVIASSGPCVTPACVLLASRVLTSMDTTTKPCDNLYQYACGKWLDSHPIPLDKSSQSTFSMLDEQNQGVIRDLMSTVNESNPSSSLVKASRMYTACMDLRAIDQRGAEPIRASFDRLGSTFVSLVTPWSATDSKQLSVILAQMHLNNSNALFSSGVGIDDRNSSRNAMFLSQGGIKLPDRDYYFQNDSDVVTAYLDNMATNFALMGVSADEAAQKSQRVFDFEVQVANFTIPSDQLRDPEKLYNPRNISQLNAESPAIDWQAYFSTLYGGDAKIQDTVVSTPTFLQNLSALIIATEKRVLVEYLQSLLVSQMASALSKPFRDNRVKFQQVLIGTEREPERWKTCLASTSSALGFAVGKLFVDRQFSPEHKTEAEAILTSVLTSFTRSFESKPWVDQPTREAAAVKSAQFTKKIGYPQMYDVKNGVDDYYTNLEIPKGKYYEAVAACSLWGSKKMLSDFGQPVDRTRWFMDPQDVNAYYSSNMNEIVFPAGILQPPFFSPAYQAMSYGGIGTVMGHEISHAFDDQGSQYDGLGNLREWWSPSVRTTFMEKTTCVSKQYSKFTVDGPEGAIHQNGNLTLGENIADNGGVRVAFDAYQNWVQQHNAEARLPGLDLSPQQLFFVGMAQIWCSNRRAGLSKVLALSDPHSAPQHRVNGVAMNSQEFAQAFGCPSGSPMNPTEKCAVW